MFRNQFVRGARPSLLCGASGKALLTGAAALALGVGLAGQAGAATVNPVQSTTYTLTPANNPVTFGTGTNINTTSGDAVYGSVSNQWSINNQGQVQSNASFSNGFTLKSISSITNSGMITAPEYAVELFNGGSVSNLTGGSINGYGAGVALSGTGSVTNAGSIVSFQQGVDVESGTVDNQVGGLIQGSFSSGVAGGNVAVTNAGTITSHAVGVMLGSNGSLTNLSGGVVNGGGTYGVLGNGAITITNAGSISATSYGAEFRGGGTLTNQNGGSLYGYFAGFAAVTESAGQTNTVNNQAGAQITGNRFGIYINNTIGLGSVTNTITNAGLISGAVGIRLDTGSITNLGGGAIYGQTAILADGAGVTVTNEAAGVISGTGLGIDFTANGGSVTNAGSITGASSVGISIQSGTVTNQTTGTIAGYNGIVGSGAGVTISNSGTIDATGTAGFITTRGAHGTGVYLANGGTVNNLAGGLISGGPSSQYVQGGVIIADAPGAVTNAGTITSTRGGMGVILEAGGSITNEAGGVLSGALAGAIWQGDAAVTNAGSMTGTFGGLAIEIGSNQTFSVTNQTTGSITGMRGVYFIGGQGTLTNSGTITGTNGEGVLASSVIAISNLAGGQISGEDGVFAAGTPTLTNAGSITGGVGGMTTILGNNAHPGVGVQFFGGAISNQSTGTISGLQGVVFSLASGTLTNAGSITGTTGYGVSLLAGGTVNNYLGGTISGISAGISSFGGATTITNAGSITSAGIGVTMGSDSALVNQTGGSITGGFFGVIDDAGSTVSNAGSISATSSTGLGIVSIDGEVANLAGGTITGGQTGVYLVSAAARLTNAGSITATGVSYAVGVVMLGGGTLGNYDNGTITGSKTGVYGGGGAVAVTNSGAITATGTGGAGVLLAAGGTVTNNAGGTISGYVSDAIVVNEGSITAVHAGSPGVLLTGGGTVTNNAGGTISGYNAVAGTNTAVTVTNSGSITGTSHGVSLAGGGNVNNLSGGYIAGVVAGVVGHDVSLTVTNAGTIKGTNAISSAGVALLAGGSVTNSAVITGATGVYASGVAATVTNAGTITGTAKHGVSLMDGGVVANLAAGDIVGATAGVGSSGDLTLTNAGTIESIAIAATSSRSDGVSALAGGSVVNQSGGVISSNDVGVYITGAAGSVTNAGSITGGAASVVFAGSGTNTLTLQAGSTLNGAAYGSTASGATNALVLQGTGTANNAFVDFNTLNVQATGSWTLGGASIIGATEVSSGTLIVTGALASAFTVDSGATLQGAGLSLEGNISDNGTLVFDQASAGTFADAITGSGELIKQNSGLLALNGVSSIAATTVNGGNLQIGDAAHASAQLTSNVTVNTGGTLSGHGTVVGNVANNGGTVSPGGTIGTLTINGNYTQTAASVLAIEVTPATSSKLVVTGAATLAGTLQFVTDPGFYRKGTQYDFLSAASVTGTFSSVTATNGATFSVTVGPNGAIVTETAGAYTPVGNATANQRAVGAAFINYPIGVSDFDPVANALIALPTALQQNAAYDRLGGEVDADFLTVARDDVRSFLSGVEDQNAGGGSPKSGPNAAWGYVTGSADTVHGDGNAHGFDQHAGGVVFGGERDLGVNTRLGAAFDYSHSDVSLQGLDQNGSLDTVAGSVYGRQSFGDLFLDAAASVGWDTGKSTRVIAFTGVDRRATGSFDGASVGGLISFGDRIHGPDGLLIEPSISLVGSSVRQGGFTESGATGADLAVDSQTQGSAEALVGARFTKSFPMASGTLNLDGRLDWAHELSNETPTLGESFAAAAGTHFVVAGADPGKDFAVIGAGLTYKASSKLSVFVRYNGGFSQRQSDQSAALGLKYAW